MEKQETNYAGHPWQVLSGTGVKVIGIILMTLNHLYQMFGPSGAPEWLGWFGRPVAVMFIFLCAEGFFYTRSRKRYILQLLGGALFMSAVNQILSTRMPLEEVVLINNIFNTLFMAAFYMWMTDRIRKGVAEKRAALILSAIWGLLLPVVLGLALILALQSGNRTALMILFFIPNPVSAEGGFVMIGMGVLFYILRKYRLVQAALVGLLSVFSWYISKDSGALQWLVVFAVIPILLYNGKRGRGIKYFFYVFYPAHIYLFYCIAWFMNRRV
jgi:hypothetical protein